MRIFITPKLLQRSSIASYRRIAEARGHTLVVRGNRPLESDAADYAVTHPRLASFVKSGVHETGFFWDAAHIDTRGLWHESALTHDGVADMIQRYEAPAPAREVAKLGDLPSKYAQRSGPIDHWDGVVLAAQKPMDRSIHYLDLEMSNDRYWAFIDRACERYKSDLLIKLHPLNCEGEAQDHRRIADKHGAACDWARLPVIDDCAFVLVYSSGFAVDAWLRGVNVAQYAPGYLYRTGGLTYTAGEIPEPGDVADLTEQSEKVLDFLAWRYCFPLYHGQERIFDVVEAFAEAPHDELVPLPERLSWGAWIQETHEQCV